LYCPVHIIMWSTGGETVLTERIVALQAEVHDLQEQNELLEFRILELEECHENVSNILSLCKG
jgi:prefoldin subunit 5